MNEAQAVRVLEAYNKESEYLFGTDFNLKILSDPDIGKMTHEQGVTTFTQISDYRKELNDFGMVYRLFIQPKDRISFARMETLYREPFIPADLLKSFLDMKQRIQTLMDGRLIGSWDGAPETYTRLHEIIMYGYLAHQNDGKWELYEEFEKHYARSWLAWTQFAQALCWHMTLIQWIQRLNEKLLVHLTPKP